MMKLFKLICAPWRKPTILEMAQKELQDANRALFRSETLLVYHQGQVATSRSLIPVLQRKIRELQEPGNA